MKNERRSFVQTVARRSAEDGEGQSNTVAGYAAVFNSVTNVGGWFQEVIAPGAFAKALQSDDVRALFNHDSGRVLGRKASGTLRLVEDGKGLAIEIDLPDTTDGRDARELIDRGDVSGMSFAFHATKQSWDETQDPPLRTLQEVELIEVSIVTFPQYDDTSIALRSRDAARQSRPHPAKLRIDLRRAQMEQKLRGIA